MSRIQYLLELIVRLAEFTNGLRFYIVEVHAHIAHWPKASVLYGAEKNRWKVPSSSKSIQYTRATFVVLR